jgi:hypothetical protein
VTRKVRRAADMTECGYVPGGRGSPASESGMSGACVADVRPHCGRPTEWLRAFAAGTEYGVSGRALVSTGRGHDRAAQLHSEAHGPSGDARMRLVRAQGGEVRWN